MGLVARFQAPVSAVLDPSAVPVADPLAGEYLGSIFDILERRQTEKPLAEACLSNVHSPSSTPGRSLLRGNTPGPLPRHIPLFIPQGPTAALFPPRVTRDYENRLCTSGSAV